MTPTADHAQHEIGKFDFCIEYDYEPYNIS